MKTPTSSAIKVHYDLRPAKQAERRIFLQMLLSAAHLRFPISDSRYVGMGGFKYYDFITFHRYLNIRNMASIERDPAIWTRCDFNKPFGFIDIYEGSASDFIAQDQFDGPNIVWLDYDQGISKDVLDDVIDLGSKLHPNSFLIISVGVEPRGPYKKKNASERLNELKQNVGTFASKLTLEDMSDTKFRTASASLVRRFAIHAFSARSDAKLFPIAQIKYRDEAYMATFAAAFCKPAAGSALRARLKKDVAFLGNCKSDEFYSIPNFNITELERRIFDRAVTSANTDQKSVDKIKELGFDDKSLIDYERLLRYFPRYFEAFL